MLIDLYGQSELSPHFIVPAASTTSSGLHRPLPGNIVPSSSPSAQQLQTSRGSHGPGLGGQCIHPPDDGSNVACILAAPSSTPAKNKTAIKKAESN